jgi:hypothetical protein
MSSFELVLEKEIEKLMDLTIPMGRRGHSKETMEMVKGSKEKYTQTKKLLEQAQKQYEKHVNKT